MASADIGFTVMGVVLFVACCVCCLAGIGFNSKRRKRDRENALAWDRVSSTLAEEPSQGPPNPVLGAERRASLSPRASVTRRPSLRASPEQAFAVSFQVAAPAACTDTDKARLKTLIAANFGVAESTLKEFSLVPSRTSRSYSWACSYTAIMPSSDPAQHESAMASVLASSAFATAVSATLGAGVKVIPPSVRVAWLSGGLSSQAPSIYAAERVEPEFESMWPGARSKEGKRDSTRASTAAGKNKSGGSLATGLDWEDQAQHRRSSAGSGKKGGSLGGGDLDQDFEAGPRGSVKAVRRATSGGSGVGEATRADEWFGFGAVAEAVSVWSDSMFAEAHVEGSTPPREDESLDAPLMPVLAEEDGEEFHF